MNRSSPSVALLLAIAAAAQQPVDLADPAAQAVPTAQPPSPAVVHDVLVPIHTAAADAGNLYGVWAAGTDYKASFHDGATLVPYLGRHYPTNQSWRWRTASVRVGERQLATAPPRLSHTALRAEYDLGGVIEAYDVRRDGLEQTFVLPTRPLDVGELVIEGAIATALRPHAEVGDGTGAGSIVFADEAGTPIVRYGAATAIDANGNRRALTTTLGGSGTLTLRLDGAWLAEAAFPVVVDPLLSVFLAANGNALADVELARDDALNSGNLWLATTRWASALDADLTLLRSDDDGGNQIVNYADLSATWSTLEPSIGMHFSTGTALTAFTRHFASNDTRRLRVHLHDRNDNLLQTGYLTVDTGSDNAWRPAVGADIGALSIPSLVIAFQQEGSGAFANTLTSDIFGVTVSLTGTGSVGVPFPIAQHAFEDAERPSINTLKLGAGQEWTVGYQVIGNNPLFSTHDDWDVAVRHVNRNGTVSAPFDASYDIDHEMAPHVGGYNDDVVISLTRATAAMVGSRPSSALGELLLTYPGRWQAGSFVLQVGIQNVLAPDPRIDLTGIDVDPVRGFAVTTYRSTVTELAYYRLIGYDGYSTDAGVLFQPTGADTTISGAVAFDQSAQQFVLAYGHGLATGGARAELVRLAYPAAPPPTLAGIGCGSGQLAWPGSQLIGARNAGIELSNVAPGALMTVAVASAPFQYLLSGIPPIVNGCWLLVPNTGPDFLGLLPPALGPSATWTFPLPSSLVSATFYFQGLHFDASNSQIYTTQRLAVPLVK